jgi:UDP-glucose/iron transport system ATP-binding protein
MLFVDRLDVVPVRVEKLRIGAGITALAAPSGAGKTRLLLAIADLIPNAGEIRLDDTQRESVPAPAWRQLVRYVTGEPSWWAPTAREHLPATAPVRDMAARLGLGPTLWDKPVAELSSGERQRFGLVRALASNPPALLLDEPTSALDAANTGQLEAELRALAEAGRVVVLVSHSEEQIRRLAGRVLTIDSGVVAERG